MPISRIDSDVDKVLKSKMDSIHMEIKDVDVDDIKTEGISVRLGNRVLKFVVDKDTPISIEDELKEEYKKSIIKKLTDISKSIEIKVNSMSTYISNIKNDYEQKKRILNDKMQNVSLMPNVNIEHACQGLSLVKGAHADSLIWFVQGIFWPKYVDDGILDPKWAKKMVTNVVFQIETDKDHIMRVSTRKPLGLDYFEHYHQSRPDCWGNWSHKSTWNTPEDIIHTGREAEAVLERINSDSMAVVNPRGLPRFQTLKRHIIPKTDEIEIKLDNTVSRIGITTDFANNQDVWS